MTTKELNESEKCIDVFYYAMEGLLEQEAYYAIDDLFLKFKDTKSITVVLMLLTTTLPAKKHLSNRTDFFNKAKQTFSYMSDCEELFAGLE